MSVSSRDEDKNTHEPKKPCLEDNDGKKYVRIWRIEASREFVLLFMFLLIGFGFMAYNPMQANLNTDRILLNQDINGAKLSDLLNTAYKFMNSTEADRKSMGVDVINVLFLYEIEQSHKLDLLLNKSNIPHAQYDLVKHNATHIYAVGSDEAITAGMNYTGFDIPYPMNITNMVKR